VITRDTLERLEGNDVNILLRLLKHILVTNFGSNSRNAQRLLGPSCLRTRLTRFPSPSNHGGTCRV